MLGDVLHDRRAALRGAAGLVLAIVGASGATAGRTGDDSTDTTDQGKGRGDCDRVVSDGDTIQDAIDDADEGDAVCVEPGTYEESISIDVEDLALRAEDAREATIDASGKGTAVYIDAAGVTLEGFEIAGDDDTTSGVTIRTSEGATADVTIVDNHIHGMARPGGGGVVAVSSWGILAYGEEPLSGVTIEGNHVESIGGEPDSLPAGAGIDLEEVEGTRPREGAVVRRNTIEGIADAAVDLPMLDDLITLPGTGIAIQPNDGESSDAGDPATDVRGNEIADVAVDVLLGEAELVRVQGNEPRGRDDRD